MKIVFCDMPMAQAQKFLKALDVVSGCRSAVELDFSFGYTALQALVRGSTYSLEEDGVYLVNSPAALQMVYEDITEDGLPSSKRFFAELVYVLSNDCILRELTRAQAANAIEDLDVGFATWFLNTVNKEALE